MAEQRISDERLQQYAEAIFGGEPTEVAVIARDLLAARGLLREVQYHGSGFATPRCQSCMSLHTDPCTPDCRLAALIGL